MYFNIVNAIDAYEYANAAFYRNELASQKPATDLFSFPREIKSVRSKQHCVYRYLYVYHLNYAKHLI